MRDLTLTVITQSFILNKLQSNCSVKSIFASLLYCGPYLSLFNHSLERTKKVILSVLILVALRCLPANISPDAFLSIPSPLPPPLNLTIWKVATPEYHRSIVVQQRTEHKHSV